MRKKLSLLTFLMMFCSFLFGQTPDWGDFNYRDYDFNMTVTAVVEIDDDEQANSNLIVAPFYGNERRGNIISGQVISGRTYYYLGIFGNYGDVVTFKLYDSENQTEYISSSSVNFVPNGIVGSPSNPYIINFNSVAKVGDVKFGSVIDAVNYAEAGQTVTLTNDSEITSTVVINKAITLDLNGKKVEQVADKNAVRVTSDNVIITDSSENGDGAILNELFYAVTVGRNDQSDRGSLTINGGKFEGQTTSVYVACGDLEIRGGEFSINEIDPQGYKYVVNLLDNKDANALIYGGTFHNFNPQNNEAEGAGTNFCAEGYIAKDNGNNTYTVIADPAYGMVARIGDTYFATLEAAIEAAQAGDEIDLLANVTIANPINVTFDLTIDGNGKTLTYTGSDRAITAESDASGADLTVKNLTVECTSSYCQRGINYNTDGTLTLEGVTVVGENTTYAINLPGSSDNAEVVIKNSSITGKIALNVWGENTTITTTDSHFTSVDKTESENYSAIAFNNDGTTSCAGTTIVMDGGSIIAKDENGEPSIAVRNSAVVAFEEGVNYSVNNTTTIVGSITTPVAVVLFEGSTNFYSCETFQEAIDEAEGNAKATVKLLTNIETSATITVDGNVKIDGNGKTLTYTGSNRAIDMPNDADANYNVTINDLTVNCTASYCERGINYNDNGELNLNKVTVQGAAYALNLPGSSDNAKVTIKDSSLTGLIALNVWGENAIINATDSHFTSVDNNTTEGYAAVKLNNDGETSAEGTVINICGGKIDVTGSAPEDTEAASNATETGVINICEDTEVNGGVKTLIAVIRYNNGTSYSFETLAEAVETAKNGETVILLRNATGAGVVINKSITIDFNGKTYTFNEGVGSTGTPSNGFQILAGNTVTLNNGTLNVAEAAKENFYILVQNYANLNVVDMTLDGTNLDKWSATDGDSYVLSNNSGEVKISGKTNIIANNDGDLAFAFDACDKSAWGYELPTVTVNTTGTIDGAIEVSANLDIKAAKLSTRNYILMQENGQFFHNGITATIKKQISKSSGVQGATTNWNTISTPVVGGSEIPEAEAGKHDLYYYDEANQYWRYVDGQGEEMKLKSGQGYLYTNREDIKFSFTGQLNTSAVNVPLLYTNGIALAGFNLIGNPFTHEISVENMVSEAVLADGFYTITKEGAWQARQGEETIAPLQSVLVKADKAATLTINPKANKTRKASNASLEIAVYNNEYKDVAYVSFGEGLGLDKIEHRNSDIPMVFIPVNGKEYAIATMSSDVKEIPVAFKAMTMGQYTFAVNTKDCEFSEMYLVDNLTGEITDLLNNEYTFLATSKDDANRFVIKFAEETETTTSTENFAYINNGEIIIDSIEGKGVVRIYDMLGRPMSEYGVSESARISTSAFADGIYIIQMSDDNGVKVQKVVID